MITARAVAATRLALFLAVLSSLASSGVSAAPVLGFRERFSGNTPGTWSGGTLPTNPGTGGYEGAGDGYLYFARPTGGNLGVRSEGPEYAGNWIAAGITQIRLWVNDVNTDDPIEIHLALGDFLNFWQYDIGIVPPNGQWAEYVVDLTNSADFTQTVGTGAETFAQALINMQKILVRHDLPPFMQTPDPVAGDVGIDHILLTNGTVGVGDVPAAVARPLRLAPPYPNPSRGPVTLAIESFDGGSVSIEILDVTGRVIRRGALPGGAAGARTWMWDGRDDRGRSVAPGQYRVRAVGPSGGMSRSLVRIR